MTDPLDDLKDIFDEELPKPRADHRAETLTRAMARFDEKNSTVRQGTEAALRQTSERSPMGRLKGVLTMMMNWNTRTILTATTALAAVTLVAVLPVLNMAPRGSVPASGGGVLEMMSSEVPSPSMRTTASSDVLADSDFDVVDDGVAAEAAPLIAMDRVIASAPPAPAASPRPSATSSRMAPTGGSGALLGGGLTSHSAGNMGATQQIMLQPQLDAPQATTQDTEAFPEAEANPLKVTTEDPVSTFSIDVDTASWSILRNSLNRGMLPPKDSVRIEEMVNYFSYDYPAPADSAPFATHVGVTDSPWRDGTQIVQIGLQGALPAERPPMNLVFLIDTSGSMGQANKLPLLKQSFRLMLGQLTEADSVAIVTYAGSAGQVLEPTQATDRATILAALDRLSAGGSTAGHAGLQQAYDTAKQMSEDGEVSRVILATDGDFNVGISDPDGLKDYIARERESGTYLSVLGFGRGNLDDATMQALAQTGNGMAAYIDTLAEAQKVLVDQLTGALVPIADDVKIQVEWNPALVAEYRLIGYETRALKREDFNNDRVDAGEIGAGHQVTALYEITPVGSPARMTDPLRYASDTPSTTDSEELGFLRLRYKAPGEDTSQLIETPINADLAPLAQADWAMAIAGFGQILRGSDLIGDWSMGDAIALAQGARGEDPFGYRQEAITLMRLAESLSQ